MDEKEVYSETMPVRTHLRRCTRIDSQVRQHTPGKQYIAYYRSHVEERFAALASGNSQCWQKKGMKKSRTHPVDTCDIGTSIEECFYNINAATTRSRVHDSAFRLLTKKCALR